MGFVGGDRGKELLAILASRGIDTDFVPVAAPTRLCISVLDQSSQAVTELVEESKTVAASDYEALKTRIQKRLRGSEAIVMSGSLTPGGPIDFYRQVTHAGRELGILTLVDAQGPPLSEALKAKPTLVKPNRAELAATVGRSLPNEGELIAAMREVLQRGAERIVVTAGKLPILALDEGNLWRIHSPTVPVVNPIGSGDAFTAGLVWRLVRKETLGEACRCAAAAGTANALSVMPGELDRRDVERLANDVTLENL